MQKTFKKSSKPTDYNVYISYIKSDTWKAKKSKYWKSRRIELLSKDPNWKPRCCCCKNKFDSIKEFDIHHLTYRNFGNEKLSELTHICRACHDKIHNIARPMGINMFRNGNNNNSLWNITKSVIANGKKQAKKQKRKMKIQKRKLDSAKNI